LTPETEGLFGREALAAMKPGAYLINVARGRIVDTEALMAALESGHLAGACLDVTDPEPLPPGHRLWKLPNVLITPHVSNDAELTDRRGSELWRENLRRFGAGEPLLNVVDKRAGY
jgi:phosphoglycerate dehydrogenase-like enzyme